MIYSGNWHGSSYSIRGRQPRDKQRMSAEYMTIQEVAAYLKISEETLYKYARHGQIPASKLGRHWRFDRQRVDDWVNHNTPSDAAQPEKKKDQSGGVSKEKGSRRVLIVDDEPMIRRLLSTWIKRRGHEVDLAGDGKEALSHMRDKQYDIIFLDLHMPDLDGISMLKRMKGTNHRPQVVIMTGFVESPLTDEAFDFELRYTLTKPLDRDLVLKLIETAPMQSMAAA